MSVWSNLVAMSFITSLSMSSYGATVFVVDGQGGPLANAVVEVLDDSVLAEKPMAIMDQVNKQFEPYVLAITQGQLVNFPNSDDIRHHVYSFSNTKPFELKLYHGTPNNPILFENPGVVVLGCNIHDSMVGYIYVAHSANVFKTNDSGTIRLPELQPQTVLRVWHPEQQQGPESAQTIRWSEVEKTGSVVINTQAPTPRNTFGEKFKVNHAH